MSDKPTGGGDVAVEIAWLRAKVLWLESQVRELMAWRAADRRTSEQRVTAAIESAKKQGIIR